MAKWCKTNGFKVAYYILPQVWAWKENRIRQLKKYCDRLIGVLPFEKEFYEQRGVDMEFVGHPLLDQISTISAPLKGQFLAMLPGSRKQEITRLMPILMELANSFPDEQFVIAALKKMQKFYPKELPVNVRIEWDNTYFVLQKSKAALVCSGTATLETTLLNVPQIVVYITNFVNYQIGKRLAKVNFISLPNLIAGEKVVEELLQQDCTAEKIGDELKKLLKTDGSQMYTKVIQKIGGPGASAKAAKIIFELAG
jgi:lipid-A-disaccharide synthase